MLIMSCCGRTYYLYILLVHTTLEWWVPGETQMNCVLVVVKYYVQEDCTFKLEFVHQGLQVLFGFEHPTVVLKMWPTSNE